MSNTIVHSCLHQPEFFQIVGHSGTWAMFGPFVQMKGLMYCHFCGELLEQGTKHE